MRADQFEGKEKALRAALAQTTERLAKHFANESAAQTASAYLQSLLSSVERKNSWQLAEVAGLESPCRFFAPARARKLERRRPARRAAWAWCSPAWVRTMPCWPSTRLSFIKQGKKSVGVKRQHTGTSGKIDNCQIGVFLSWQTSKGHALIDRALYLPEEWAEDAERRRAAGVPEEVKFATKPALARGMVARVLAAGASPAWVVAGCVYGADYKLRSALEEAGQPCVLAVTGQQCVWRGCGQQRVKTLKAQVPAEMWVELRVAQGTKGPRVFEWAALPINHPHGEAWQRFLLLRRSRSAPEEITACLVFGPARTTLEEMARIAARRWATLGELCAGQKRGGPGSVRGAKLGRLAAAHDFGA